MLNIQ